MPASAGHPDIDAGNRVWEQPADGAEKWWCPKCGGIDAPQPCLGVCVWREIDWVERSLYDDAREPALSERATEQRLRRVLRRIASVTPRPGGWESSGEALQREAAPPSRTATLSSTAPPSRPPAPTRQTTATERPPPRPRRRGRLVRFAERWTRCERLRPPPGEPTASGPRASCSPAPLQTWLT